MLNEKEIEFVEECTKKGIDIEQAIIVLETIIEPYMELYKKNYNYIEKMERKNKYETDN